MHAVTITQQSGEAIARQFGWVRGMRDFLKLQGVNVSQMTVYSWIGKYLKLMECYLEKLMPQVSDVCRTDELYVKIKGEWLTIIQRASIESKAGETT